MKSYHEPWTPEWMAAALSDQSEGTIGAALSLVNLQRTLPLLQKLWKAAEDADRQLPVHPALRGVRVAINELRRMETMTFADLTTSKPSRKRRGK